MATQTDRLAGLQASVAVKAPVDAVTTGPISLASLVQGTLLLVSTMPSLVEGARVLVKDQVNPVENGIYEASSSTWVRTLDFDGYRDVVNGTLIVVPFSIGTCVFYSTQCSDQQVIPGTSAITFGLLANPNVNYPRTQAEINAAVTPTNYAYPALGNPGFDPRRYGVDPTGAAASDAGLTSMLAVAAQIGAANGTPIWITLNQGALYTFNSQVTISSANNVGINLNGSTLRYTGATISTDNSAGAFVYFSGTDHSFGGIVNGFVDANTKAAFGVYAAGNFNTNFQLQYLHVKNALLDGICCDASGTQGPTNLVIHHVDAFPAVANFNGTGVQAVCGRYIFHIRSNQNVGLAIIRDCDIDNGVSGFVGITATTSFAGWDTVLDGVRFETWAQTLDAVQLNYGGAVTSAGSVTLKNCKFSDSTAGVTAFNLVRNTNAALNVRPPVIIDPVIAASAYQFIYKDTNNAALNVAYDAKRVYTKLTLNMPAQVGQIFPLGSAAAGAPDIGEGYLDTTNKVVGFTDVNGVQSVIEFGQSLTQSPASNPTAAATDTNVCYTNLNNATFTYTLPAISTTYRGWKSPLFLVTAANVMTITANGADKIGTKAVGSSYTSSTIGNSFRVQAAAYGAGPTTHWVIIANTGFV